MTSTCLLNLVVSPEVESIVTDWLLEQAVVSGFSSHPIAGHGSSEQSMTLAERVAGTRRQVLFQFELPCDDANALLDGIRAQFAGSGMHFWLQPVLQSGHLD
jgi:hypothetical protein